MYQRIKDIVKLNVRADGTDWFFAFIISCLIGAAGLVFMMAIAPGEVASGWPLLATLATPALRVVYLIVLKVSGVQFDECGRRRSIG